jgi:hypothetical protein
LFSLLILKFALAVAKNPDVEAAQMELSLHLVAMKYLVRSEPMVHSKLKMNQNLDELVRYFQNLDELVQGHSNPDVVEFHLGDQDLQEVVVAELNRRRFRPSSP